MSDSTFVCLLILNLILYGSSFKLAEDATLKYSESIGIANKLLSDIEQNIENYLDRPTGFGTVSLSKGNEQLMSKNADDNDGQPSPSVPLSTTVLDENVTQSNNIVGQQPVSPAEPNNIQELTASLNELDKKLQETYQALQQRRRFVLGAMIRQMQSTVRRIRQNVVRIQVQLNTIGTVATQLPTLRVNGTTSDASASSLNASREYIVQIEEQMQSVSKKINDIVTRLNSSLKGSNQPLAHQPLNPIMTLNSIIQNAGHSGKQTKN